MVEIRKLQLLLLGVASMALMWQISRAPQSSKQLCKKEHSFMIATWMLGD